MLLALATAAPLVAQAPPPPPEAPDSVRISALLREANLGSWHVLVESRDGTVLEGEAEWRGPGTIRVAGRRVRAANVVRVERRVQEGGSAHRGFIAGSTVGALAVFGFAAALCDTGHRGGCPGLAGVALAALMGPILGGIPGAVIGGLVDPPDVVWRPLWPAP